MGGFGDVNDMWKWGPQPSCPLFSVLSFFPLLFFPSHWMRSSLALCGDENGKPDEVVLAPPRIEFSYESSLASGKLSSPGCASSMPEGGFDSWMVKIF